MEAIARERGLDPSDIEIWFGDEARVGQKNKITRRWARRGSRPSAPSDQRTASTYIFGAICPAEGKAVGLILPWCNTAMMNLHLAAISADVAPGRHAALLLDQAGWHLSQQARRAGQHHHRAPAGQMPRTEPAGERLAVHARQLALQPCVRRHPTTSSITAATPGTSWRLSPGPSCPSDCAIGPTGSDQ